ncbi:MAG: hypothetical protein ACE5J7_04535 [Candidatus Aenigmatarchaeota archaeon]
MMYTVSERKDGWKTVEVCPHRKKDGATFEGLLAVVTSMLKGRRFTIIHELDDWALKKGKYKESEVKKGTIGMLRIVFKNDIGVLEKIWEDSRAATFIFIGSGDYEKLDLDKLYQVEPDYREVPKNTDMIFITNDNDIDFDTRKESFLKLIISKLKPLGTEVKPEEYYKLLR